MEKIALSIPGTNGTPIQIDSGVPVPTGGLTDNAGKIGAGKSVILTFLVLFVLVVFFFAFWSILKGSLAMIQSAGHKEALQKGRDRILFTFLGFLMLLISFLLIRAFGAALKVDLLCIVLKPFSSTCEL